MAIDREELAQRVKTLKGSNLPCCTFDDLFQVSDGVMPTEDRLAIDIYLSRFLRPQGDEKGLKCVLCGVNQTDFVAAMLGTGFRYGLQHGEGRCATCGYPARTHHYDVGPLQRFEFLLQYHPSELQ